MTTHQILPPDFEALQPFVDRWALPTTAGRARCRSESTAEERQAFYNAAAPLLEPAIAYLDARPLAALDAGEKQLLNLVLSLAHVQMAVEVHKEMEPRHAAFREAMVITRSVTDLA